MTIAPPLSAGFMMLSVMFLSCLRAFLSVLLRFVLFVGWFGLCVNWVLRTCRIFEVCLSRLLFGGIGDVHVLFVQNGWGFCFMFLK